MRRRGDAHPPGLFQRRNRAAAIPSERGHAMKQALNTTKTEHDTTVSGLGNGICG
ncbi:hypothetical protein [Kitasatospora sp. LaBMicrA B282]|uniref:hypothetical protein n=1 Tax=Kitasatospora sp. LaBMicrA B282 TaxID=3420949 RepID=UPI003D104692